MYKNCSIFLTSHFGFFLRMNYKCDLISVMWFSTLLSRHRIVISYSEYSEIYIERYPIVRYIERDIL